MRLIHKILLGYFLIVSILGTFSTLILFYNIEKNSNDLNAYREREITSFAKLMDAFIPDEESLKNLEPIEELFRLTMDKLPHIKRLTLHAQDKKTLHYIHLIGTANETTGSPSHQEDIDVILQNKSILLYEDAENGDHYLDITYPILGANQKPIAALGIAVSLKESDHILEKSISKMKTDAIESMVLAITISMILSLIFAFIISKIIISPLEKLKRATVSASALNLGETIEISSNDEISEVAEEFNKMTLELQRMYNSMDDQIQEKTKELKEQFFIDNLTGLNNRNALFHEMKNLKTFHVAILDVASFKDINDAYGIEIGNKVLQELSKKYNYYITDTDLKLYRLSGDEMAILNIDIMPETKFADEINKIINLLEHETFYFDDDIEINISVHAGISYETEHSIEKANIALIKAKKSHTNYAIFSHKEYEDNQQRKNIKMISKIKHAISNFGIIVHYQAIVDKKHNIVKYEALVRMKDENKILSPYFFLDISKKTKYYQEITKSVIFIALNEFKNRDEYISLNLCTEDIENIKTQEFIKEQLKDFHNPSRIIFELVESEDMNQLPELGEFISYIKSTGAKIAIDDFGTGYSNFAYLMDLEPDYLKIDGSLIKNIDKDKRSYDIVKTIVNFAHGLDIKVIAEFIHSKEVLEVCETLNIDEFQGYYFSEPSSL